MNRRAAGQAPAIRQLRVAKKPMVRLDRAIRALNETDLAFAAGAAPSAGAVNCQTRPIRRVEHGRSFRRVGDQILWKKSNLIFHLAVK